MLNIVSASPCDFSKISIESFSERVSSELGYDPETGIQIFVSNLGGRISVIDVWDEASGDGSLIVDGPGNFEIRIPTHTSIQRDNFTIAHELGHYFLHYLIKRDEIDLSDAQFVVNRMGSNRVEWEANWFASAFLMPKKSFSELYKQVGGNLAELSKQFDVSVTAANIRSKSLNLVT